MEQHSRTIGNEAVSDRSDMHRSPQGGSVGEAAQVSEIIMGAAAPDCNRATAQPDDPRSNSSSDWACGRGLPRRRERTSSSGGNN